MRQNVSRVKPAQKDQQEWDNEAVNFVLDAEDLEDEADQVRPLCQRSFLQVIQDAGIKYTTTFHPHECPIHSQGRQVYDVALAKAEEGEKKLLESISNQQHANATKELTQLQETQLRVLRQKRDDALSSIKTYERHMEQFKVCRNYVHDIEDNLELGVCLVYRDFVSQYLFGAELLGNKMNNLQLVLVWRDPETACVTSFKVANFCSDKDTMAHDAWFTADVFNFHMGTAENEEEANSFSGLFASFHTIFLVGDHGPHFSCRNTYYNESLMQTKSNKNIHVLLVSCWG
jgi:hypothetical protein